MSVSQARQQFSETLNRVYQENARIVVEKNGIAVAAIVPMAVARMADEREHNRWEFQQVLKDMRAGFAGVPEEEIEREIAMALADIKRECRLARRIVSAIGQVSPNLFEATNEQLEASVANILKEGEARSVAASLRGTDSGS